MSIYKHILLAADFSAHGKMVAERAKQLADLNQAKLSIIHVVDNLPVMDATYGPVIPFDVDFTEELMKAAKQRLATVATNLHIEEDCQWLEMGSPKMEIIRVAEEEEVDLIIVGSHGRHGLALLLGSTANGVLHHARCDVLAVRLQDE
jgi:universal stress protein A